MMQHLANLAFSKKGIHLSMYIFKLRSINRNDNVIRNSVGKTFAADGKKFSFLFIE